MTSPKEPLAAPGEAGTASTCLATAALVHCRRRAHTGLSAHLHAHPKADGDLARSCKQHDRNEPPGTSRRTLRGSKATVSSGTSAPTDKCKPLQLEARCLAQGCDTPPAAKHPSQDAMSRLWSGNTHASPMGGSTNPAQSREQALHIREASPQVPNTKPRTGS